MIHQLLTLTRPLFVLDTETTGLDPQKDRIVELAFEQWTTKGMIKEWRTLVNPGVPIPTSATKVHGITNMKVKACRECGGDPWGVDVTPNTLDERHCKCPVIKLWPTFKQLAPNLAKGFTDCDFAGQNVRFDLRMLVAEFARVGVTWSYTGARIIDSSMLERLAVPRNLSALHEKYVGRPHDGAHGALSDVRAAATVIAAQLGMYPSLPHDLDALHKAQWPGELDEGGKFKIVDGVATCQFGKHRGKAMRDIPTDYYDWLIKSEFPADVKVLAAQAKLGKFPEVR